MNINNEIVSILNKYDFKSVDIHIENDSADLHGYAKINKDVDIDIHIRIDKIDNKKSNKKNNDSIKKKKKSSTNNDINTINEFLDAKAIKRPRHSYIDEFGKKHREVTFKFMSFTERKRLIDSLLDELGLPQKDVANYLGCSQGVVSSIHKKTTRTPFMKMTIDERINTLNKLYNPPKHGLGYVAEELNLQGDSINILKDYLNVLSVTPKLGDTIATMYFKHKMRISTISSYLGLEKYIITSYINILKGEGDTNN